MDNNKEIAKMKAKAVESQNQWYNVQSVLEHSRDIYYILLSARDAGKNIYTIKVRE